MHLQIEYKETAKLIPYVNNSRTHSDEQVKQVASSIKEFGFTNPILIDEKDGIIAGHGRLLAAQLLDMESVPTIRLVGLSEAQAKAYVIADNKLALNSGWDDALLKVEIETLKDLDFDTDLLGWDVLPDFSEEVDYSILDGLDDSDAEAEEMSSDVKKAIQIEFEPDDYQIAQQMIKEARESGVYIGGALLNALSSES